MGSKIIKINNLVFFLQMLNFKCMIVPYIKMQGIIKIKMNKMMIVKFKKAINLKNSNNNMKNLKIFKWSKILVLKIKNKNKILKFKIKMKKNNQKLNKN